jgi:hypothetical protein
MYSLIYISVATKVMQQETLSEILEQSRASNKERNLTGCLAYIEGGTNNEQHCRFIQVLEGPEFEVLSVFKNIQKDTRHTEVTLIKQGPMKNRNFSDWQMGFEKITLSPKSALQGFFNLDPEILATEGDMEDNMLLNFMKSFYKHLR